MLLNAEKQPFKSNSNACSKCLLAAVLMVLVLVESKCPPSAARWNIRNDK